MSYNILNGGEGRADPLAEVIEAQNPDIVTLIEADYLPVVERIAGRLKMDFTVGHGPRHAAAILSRWTIRDSVNHTPLHEGFTASFLQATIIAPDRSEWTVAAIHLHPRALEADEAAREQQLSVIVNTTENLRQNGRPHLLMGDFNANAPQQQIDISKAKPSTREAFEKNGGHVPRRAIQRVLDAGYVDALRAVHGDRADTIGTFSTQHPQQRVDYIFANGIEPARIRTAWVEQDRLATYASDHYPVGVEII